MAAQFAFPDDAEEFDQLIITQEIGARPAAARARSC